MSKSVLLIFSLLVFKKDFAQTITDNIFIPTHSIAAEVTYERASFNKYWEAHQLVQNGNIATVVRTTIRPIISYGVSNKLNVYATIPYIKMESVEPNGGHLDNIYGLQDLSMYAKYKILQKNISDNEFTFSSTLGFSFKPSKYSPDMGFYSLGLGAPELSLRGIASYSLKHNLYLRTAAGYLWRGKAKIYEDVYFYKNQIVYSSKMEVPDAIALDLAVGLWSVKKKLKTELNYCGLKSLNGDNIRYYAAPKAANKVNYDRVELLAQYFINKHIGLTAHYNTVLNGMNTPKFAAFGGGFIFKFNVE